MSILPRGPEITESAATTAAHKHVSRVLEFEEQIRINGKQQGFIKFILQEISKLEANNVDWKKYIITKDEKNSFISVGIENQKLFNSAGIENQKSLAKIARIMRLHKINVESLGIF